MLRAWDGVEALDHLERLGVDRLLDIAVEAGRAWRTGAVGDAAQLHGGKHLRRRQSQGQRRADQARQSEDLSQLTHRASVQAWDQPGRSLAQAVKAVEEWAPVEVR